MQKVDSTDKYGTTMLVWATRNGHAETVKFLLEQGADLEASGFGGMKPLHHACNQIKEEMMVELISKGADSNSVDDAGNTPMHWACERGVLNPVQARAHIALPSSPSTRCAAARAQQALIEARADLRSH